jgi:hypothetical protein
MNAAPIAYSRTLVAAGFAGFVVAEFASASFAFSQSARSVVALGVPVDVAVNVGLSCLAAIICACGPAVAAHLWRLGRVRARKQAQLAVLVVAIAALYSAGNLSGYFAWTRAEKVAIEIKASAVYADALATLADRNAAWEDRKEARATIEEAEDRMRPTRNGSECARGLAVHLLLIAMTAAFRVPSYATGGGVRLTPRDETRAELMTRGERRARAIELRAQGRSMRQIAAELGVGLGTVGRALGRS